MLQDLFQYFFHMNIFQIFFHMHIFQSYRDMQHGRVKLS